MLTTMNDIIIIESIWQIIVFILSIFAAFMLFYVAFEAVLFKLTLSEIKRTNKEISDLKIENWKVETV